MKMENQFLFLESKDRELYYDFKKELWVHKFECIGGRFFPCRSFRSAKRHLRKHNEIPKGTKFILVSKFIGYDRILIKK